MQLQSKLMTRRYTQSGKAHIGIVIAVLVGVGFASLIAWFVVTGNAPNRAGVQDRAHLGDVPTLDELLTERESGKGLNLQFADKDDPSRIAATLEADSYNPVKTNGRIEPSLYQLEKVRAKVFLDTGETVLIESDSGRFFMPNRQTGPESGSLIGTPTITLLPKEVNNPSPQLVAMFTEALNFNFNYSHVETTGRVEVLGRGVEFVGHHLTARLNQQRKRIDVLEVERGEYIKYDPTLARAGRPAQPAIDPAPEDASITPPSTNTGTRAAKPSPEPKARIVHVAYKSSTQATPDPPADAHHLALYLATFENSVDLRQGTRRVTSDLLESWVRLIDHKLPDRTAKRRVAPTASASPSWVVFSALVAQVDEQADSDGDAAATDIQPNLDEPIVTASTEIAPFLGVGSTPSDELIELSWTGQLRVVPLVNAEPTQLSQDDATFRFTSTETGLVRFEDKGAQGHAAVAEYAATRDAITLMGPGGSVMLEADDKGWIEATKTVVRLATGDVTVIGPGQVNDGIRPSPGGRGSGKYVRWLDQADFVFDTFDGRMTGDIRSAQFSGQARAVDGDRRFDGSMLTARFEDDKQGKRLVSKVEGYDLNATDGKGATMSGQRVQIPFRMIGSGKSEPAEVYASGDVVVERDGSRIASQALSATLTQDDDGTLVVSDVVAEREASYTDGQDITATADRIEANGLREIASLFGTEHSPARVDYGDSIIIGPRINFSQHPQRGSVVGAGTFEQDNPDAIVRASWQDFMSFDRSLGVLECVGQASIDQTLLAIGERRTTRGEHLTVEFVDQGGELVFDAATVFGTDEELASVESRQGRTDNADEPISLIHLRAVEILATGGGDGLIVPVRGQLVVLDRRVEAKSNLDGWDRGHAMFSWRDTMVVDRLLGTVRMSGEAHAIHRTMDDGRTAEIAADTIMAYFVETEADGYQITSLDALGTAYFRMEDREVLAALLRFDSESKVLNAIAGPGSPIRFIDNATGAVMTAQSLEWDLGTDRIVLDQPSPLSLPREPSTSGK